MAKRILFSVFVLTIFFFVAKSANAAELFLYPKEYQVTPGNKFVVDIRLDGKFDSINVVKVKLLFPVKLLKVDSASTQGSFLRLFPEGPTIDAENGAITLTGGIQNGAFVAGGRVATITFDALTQGTADLVLDLSYSRVLLNDGKGTQAPLSVTGGSYNIIEQIINGLVISSPSHPDENTWYQNGNVVLQWQAKQDAQYSFVISKNPFENPDTTPDTFTGTATYQDMPDGAYFFIVRERINGSEWQLVGRRKVLIDKTQPLPIEYAIGRDTSVYSGNVFLAFSVSDQTSGINRVDVIEGKETTINATSPYILKDPKQRSYLAIRAYDKAGNVRELVINPGTRGVITIIIAISIGVLALLGGILVVWLMIRKKKDREALHGSL